MNKNKIILLVSFILLSSSGYIFAQTPLPQGMDQISADQPDLLIKMLLIAGLTLLPFFILLLTSFLKMVVVLALLRNALGVQQTPPNQVLNGIALLLSIYVMFPTGLAMYNSAKATVDASPPQAFFSEQTVFYVINVANKAKEPLRDFLFRNSIPKHVNSFCALAQKTFPENYRTSVTQQDFIVLMPAFITSQLKGAFEIGVLIYLPFFVIDIVTSNILLAMGMMMLSPLTISLPIKLLLLVMIDGWTILVQGLVLTFK